MSLGRSLVQFGLRILSTAAKNLRGPPQSGPRFERSISRIIDIFVMFGG